MQRGAKIALASGIVLTGLVGATLFRKPPRTAAPSEAEPPQLDRLTTCLPPDNPYGAARLSDQIDPVAAAEQSAAEKSPTEPSAGEQSAADRPSTASQVEMRPQSDRSQDRPAGEFTAAQREPGQPSPRRRRMHRVRDGDTLSSLADEYLGSSSRYLEIYEANRRRLSSPDLLPIGAELEIPWPDEPPAKVALQTRGEPAAEAPLSPLSPRPAVARPAPPGVKRTYRVKAGDTLAAIARQFYGDAERYQDIYEANRQRLQAPEDLREGVVLDIP